MSGGRYSAVVDAARAAGLADGNAVPTGRTRNPYAPGTVEAWVWLRWYIRTRLVTAAATYTERTQRDEQS